MLQGGNLRRLFWGNISLFVEKTKNMSHFVSVFVCHYMIPWSILMALLYNTSSDVLKNKRNKRMKDWMDGWMNEWIYEWMNEWMNERSNE